MIEFEVQKIVEQYCNDIKSGTISSCSYTKKAIRRFEKDIHNSKLDSFDFFIDWPQVQNFYDFSKLLKLPDQGGKTLELLPWQLFCYANILGWYYKSNHNKRRFRNASIYVPRKNGKTSGFEIPLSIWDLITTPAAETYLFAYTETQAEKTFKEIVATLNNIEELKDWVTTTTKAAVYKNSRISYMSPDTNSDGYKPSLGIIDEYFCLPDEKPVTSMRYGGRARLNSLTLIITTAGTDTSLPAFEEEQKMKKILDGVYDDPYYFCIFYGADDKDDWKKSETYIKANPSIGKIIDPALLEQDLQDALNDSRRQSEYIAKTLNRWTNGECAWIKIDDWTKNKDISINLEDLKENIFFAGIDFSEDNDWTALTFYTYVEQIKKFAAFHKFYIPEETIRLKYRTENINLQKWIDDELVIPTNGKTIDYTYIVKYFIDFCVQFKVKQLSYDPWKAKNLIDSIESQNGSCEYVPFQQSLKSISPNARAWEKEILDGNIVDNNPIMIWMTGNTIVKPDINGNIKPQKKYKSSTGKIDGVISSIMAFSACFEDRKNHEPQSAYNNFDELLSYF